jgi:hypothetical protein
LKVPNHQNAFIPERKITAYLLSATHPDGSSKALFFTRFGFSLDDWWGFADALLNHIASHHIVEVMTTPFGKKYVVDGPLDTPDGRKPMVRSVWFVAEGETIPQLTTAYPAKRSKR